MIYLITIVARLLQKLSTCTEKKNEEYYFKDHTSYFKF